MSQEWKGGFFEWTNDVAAAAAATAIVVVVVVIVPMAITRYIVSLVS